MAMTEKQLRKTAETAVKTACADVARQSRAVFHDLEEQYTQCRDALFSLPDEIEEARNSMSDLQRRVKEYKEDVDLAESMIFMQVSVAQDNNGKKLYSNKESREAAAEIKKQDEEYRSAVKGLRDAEQEVESAQFKVDKLYNEFKACRAMAEMLAARMYLFSKCG